MKNKGFTLIELLAVIVILAIIALIATPIILGIINNAKEESNKRSIEMYAKALENSIVKYQLSGKKLEISELETIDGRNFLNIEDFKVEYDGNVVCNTIELYTDATFYLADCKVNDTEVKYTYGKDQTYDNGQIVYFDVYNGVGCTKEEYESSWSEEKQDYLNSEPRYNGINGIGKKNSCLKFYAFNDAGGDKINLLLDHNTTVTGVAWRTVSERVNKNGPIDALSQLYNDTKDWNGTLTLSPYHMDQSNQISAAKYTINYEDYKARLITAQEIAQIIKADKKLNWNERLETNGRYYLDSISTEYPDQKNPNINSTTLSEYYWLYDRTFDCKNYGCITQLDSSAHTIGYWTSSSTAGYTHYAWFVSNEGNIVGHSVDMTLARGIRPVIEVLKSKLL